MSDPLDLTGQRVLVTGAASGIGRSTCELLSRLGSRVIATDVNVSGLAATSGALAGNGHTTSSFDLLDIERIPDWMADVAADGRLTGVVHAAGITLSRPVRLTSPADYRPLITVNTEAAIGLARGFARQGTASPDGGAIVFVSSILALVGSPGATAYAVSKAALTGLAKSLALELAPRRVRVNCVAPGYVRTAMFDRAMAHLSEEQRSAIEAHHPLGIGEPEDVAHAIAFLVARTGRWVTGSTLVIDGGYTAH